MNIKANIARILGPLFLITYIIPGAQAAVMMYPQFVNPGSNAIGIEPEVVFTNGGGIGATVKYQHGISELSNLYLDLGTGTGVRRFRLGAGMSFDFFPDVDRQPGIGIMLGTHYYRYNISDISFGQMTIEGSPYIHKTFKDAEGREVEPYFSLPLAMQFRDSQYNIGVSSAFGAMFRERSGGTAYAIELGVNIQNSETYLSGGVVFYP